jgi:uncharacterized repeat protein (TIGR01451 family)
MRTQAVAGYVTKTGNVYANGELVATGAITAGRSYIAGSTKVTYNGTTFYKRAPSVSFTSSSIKAYVVMVNGKFSHAILASCGNPVVATPKSPDYAMSKAVRVKGQSTWVNDVTVKSGTHVEYRIQVVSRGQVSARNIVVRDVLPANTKYVGYTMKRDGVAITSSGVFGTGDIISTLAPGKFVTYTFEAIIGSSDKVETCVPQKLINTAKVAVPGLPSKSDTADVNKTCAPKPAYACTSLTGTKVNRTSYSFASKATVSGGAAVAGYKYVYGDGQSQTVNSTATTNTVSHTYAKAGTYTATVTVLVKVGTETKEVTSANCKIVVTVVAAPAAECKDLVLTRGAGRLVTATVTYDVSGGATLKNIAYNFGDNTAVVNSTDKSVDHTYAADGSYTVKATLTFNGTEAVPSSTCEDKVTVNTVTPAYSCDAFSIAKGEGRMVNIDNFKYSATGGATFKNVTIDWGDNTTPLVSTSPVGQTHTYATDGSYTVKATASFMVNGQEVTNSDDCEDQVVFSPAPVCEINPNLPKDSPDCKVCQYNPELPYNSEDCKQPETPQVLPATGIGSVLGLFVGTAATASIGYYFVAARRLVRG